MIIYDCIFFQMIYHMKKNNNKSKKKRGGVFSPKKNKKYTNKNKIKKYATIGIGASVMTGLAGLSGYKFHKKKLSEVEDKYNKQLLEIDSKNKALQERNDYLEEIVVKEADLKKINKMLEHKINSIEIENSTIKEDLLKVAEKKKSTPLILRFIKSASIITLELLKIIVKVTYDLASFRNIILLFMFYKRYGTNIKGAYNDISNVNDNKEKYINMINNNLGGISFILEILRIMNNLSAQKHIFYLLKAFI